MHKYAEGELGEDKSFYFPWPNGSLNFRHTISLSSYKWLRG